jgi:transporter family protein
MRFDGCEASNFAGAGVADGNDYGSICGGFSSASDTDSAMCSEGGKTSASLQTSRERRMQSYVYWALVGMVGYSLTTLFTKLAERSGEVSSYMVLAVSSIIVPIIVIAIVGFRGELKPLIYDLEKGTLAWAIAGGFALTVAVTSLFHALSLGPANVVVPIYGMFIVGGSLLGVLFLGEPMTWYKIVGLAAAVIGVVLISF